MINLPFLEKPINIASYDVDEHYELDVPATVTNPVEDKVEEEIDPQPQPETTATLFSIGNSDDNFFYDKLALINHDILAILGI